MLSTKRQNLGNAEAAGRADQQHVRVRHEQIRQRIERAGRVPAAYTAGQRQAGDAGAVPVQAKTAWRVRIAQHRGVVGNVGVHPFGKIVEQQIIAARREDARRDAGVRRMQRSIDRLVLADRGLWPESEQRLAQQQSEECCSAGGAGVAADQTGGQRQRRQQRRDQREGRTDEHQRQHGDAPRRRRPAGPRRRPGRCGRRRR